MCEYYVKTDTLLLACCVENFRLQCLKLYKLDPMNYLTLAGLTLDAFLKYSGVRLELLTDLDTFLFIEDAIKGGIYVISHRFAEANNKYMDMYVHACTILYTICYNNTISCIVLANTFLSISTLCANQMYVILQGKLF